MKPKRFKPQGRSEALLHQDVADFLRLALREPKTVWTTFPAGGGGKVRGAKLKRAGLRAGWPDIQVISHASGTGALVRFLGIELKAPRKPRKGDVSDAQEETLEAIFKAGGSYAICRSVAEVEAALRRAYIPCHATVLPGGGARVLANLREAA